MWKGHKMLRGLWMCGFLNKLDYYGECNEKEDKRVFTLWGLILDQPKMLHFIVIKIWMCSSNKSPTNDLFVIITKPCSAHCIPCSPLRAAIYRMHTWVHYRWGNTNLWHPKWRKQLLHLKNGPKTGQTAQRQSFVLELSDICQSILTSGCWWVLFFIFGEHMASLESLSSGLFFFPLQKQIQMSIFPRCRLFQGQQHPLLPS